MTRTGDLFLENEAVVAAAAVAAQATLGLDGFRQRDVRFYIGLFSNWLEAMSGSWTLVLHNAQVQRYLESLVRRRWAKRIARSPPRYQLTAEGLACLLGRMAERKSLKRLDEFFFVLHVFHAYGDRLRSLVAQAGPFRSKFLSVNLDELLSVDRLVAREREQVDREIERLARRIQESKATSVLAQSLLAEQRPLADVIATIEQRYPYELNSQKPLGELFAQMPEPFRRVELEQVTELRARYLWEPTRELLTSYRSILDQLPSTGKETRREKGHHRASRPPR